jgi:hypothetical protein
VFINSLCLADERPHMAHPSCEQLPGRTAGHGSKADAWRSAARWLPERERASPDQEIERLRRTEEAIVVATGAAREHGCPAWVVLGVKPVEARAVRAGDGRGWQYAGEGCGKLADF